MQVRAGQALPAALGAFFAEHPDSHASARGAVQDLAYRTMRWRGTAQALLARLSERTPDPALAELLVVALAQWVDPAHPYADHVLVDQCVEAVGADRRTQRAVGFANAVLRRALRERETLIASLEGEEEAFWNYPAWWINALRRELPRRWQEVLAAGNQQPPLTIRVNQRRASVAQVHAMMEAAGIQVLAVSGIPGALRLSPPKPVAALPGFAQGCWSVQDAGAQLAAPWLDVHDGMRVLDACAAPGGKTGHLLEIAQLDLLALDHDAQRLARVDENLARLGLQARTCLADAATPAAWWDGKPFDRILADVPCTASGIVRRHPDVRWLRRPEDIGQLATSAAGMLDALWSVLAVNGKMLIVSCSVFEAEGPAQLASFLERHPDSALDTADTAQNPDVVSPEQCVVLQTNTQHAQQEADAFPMTLRAWMAQNQPGPLYPTVAGGQCGTETGHRNPLETFIPPQTRTEDDLDHDGFFYARVVKRSTAG
jgi:16S rRNA (cytosine967-C5)-methyltransferase